MKISYLELLEMIKEGREPKRIEWEGCIYEWGTNLYSDLSGNCFNSLLAREHTDDFLARKKCIEIVREILTKKEKKNT